MSFEPVFPSSSLAPGAVKVVKESGQQVAVFRLRDGGLAAVDNRCPHEGYPLSQGSCTGGTLTCCYHNFKFDLATGACLKGDEAVRVVPARERDGQVELDLTPPDPAIARAKAERGFRTALVEGRVGQALRDTARRLSSLLRQLGELGLVGNVDELRESLDRLARYPAEYALAVGALRDVRQAVVEVVKVYGSEPQLAELTQRSRTWDEPLLDPAQIRPEVG